MDSNETGIAKFKWAVGTPIVLKRLQGMIAATLPEHQGRAAGLYDEQLQRQLQEKLLFRRARADRPSLPADLIPLCLADLGR